jgi:hypothetical protein
MKTTIVIIKNRTSKTEILKTFKSLKDAKLYIKKNQNWYNNYQNSDIYRKL